MDSAVTLLVHTDEAALVESTPSAGSDGSKEPTRVRGAISSAVEHCFHTAGVSGSNPLSPTTLTSWRGDICETLAAAEFMRLGYGVSRPLSNAMPYDLVVDNGRRLFKVQVKSLAMKGDVLSASLVASKYHRSKRAPVSYAGRIDWFVMVSPELGRCFFAPDPELRSIQLRLSPSRNNQSSGVRWADDYELKTSLGPCCP
jgi:hypothetical protein